jgi:hypothetical protein
MLADAQSMKLEPLIEACRPKGKTPPQDLRRTIAAIVWRHQTGPSGAPSPPTWVAGPVPLRPSSAGPGSGSGSGFWRWSKNATFNSG